jgi:hypothetical protein
MPGQSSSAPISNGQIHTQSFKDLRTLLEESKRERESRPVLIAFTMKIPVKMRRMLKAVANKYGISMTSIVIAALEPVLPTLLDGTHGELRPEHTSTGERTGHIEVSVRF